MPLAAFSILVDLLAWPACAALASGVYQTVPGATVEERGDRVPNRSRVVPLFATLAFDLSATEPSLTAVITNAVLEGGEPFSLTVPRRTVFSAEAPAPTGWYYEGAAFANDLFWKALAPVCPQRLSAGSYTRRRPEVSQR